MFRRTHRDAVGGEIFVFGSNLAGIHGAGSALAARVRYGAILGQGIGRQGNSYAIPTKDKDLKVLPLDQIQRYVDVFIDYSRQHEELDFFIVRIGCGLAGYKDYQIAPMFSNISNNCLIPNEWVPYV